MVELISSITFGTASIIFGAAKRFNPSIIFIFASINSGASVFDIDPKSADPLNTSMKMRK